MADLTRTQIAAALAESVYRRSPDDQPIDPIQNLGGADVDLANISLPGLSSPAGIASKRQPLAFLPCRPESSNAMSTCSLFSGSWVAKRGCVMADLTQAMGGEK